MAQPTYHLAQLNVGKARAEMDDPVMHGFVSRLDAINALADNAEGFVWRLQSEAGDATALRPFDDDLILVNMSVWETLAALRAYVYKSAHTEVMKNRKQWFEAFGRPYMVLWWVPAGHLPTLQEAKERLERLQRFGSSAEAFTFAHPFPAPSEGE